MKVAITGATGRVGHWIAAHLLARGHDVVTLGRRPSWHARAAFRAFDLDGPPPDLSGSAALVHCAFDHVPGRYRGGEGDDPEGFPDVVLGVAAAFPAPLPPQASTTTMTHCEHV